jgi:hypothetical protein
MNVPGGPTLGGRPARPTDSGAPCHLPGPRRDDVCRRVRFRRVCVIGVPHYERQLTKAIPDVQLEGRELLKVPPSGHSPESMRKNRVRGGARMPSSSGGSEPALIGGARLQMPRCITRARDKSFLVHFPNAVPILGWRIIEQQPATICIGLRELVARISPQRLFKSQN